MALAWALERNPGFIFAVLPQAAAYAHIGREEEARAVRGPDKTRFAAIRCGYEGSLWTLVDRQGSISDRDAALQYMIYTSERSSVVGNGRRGIKG